MTEILFHYCSLHAQERAAERLGFVPGIEEWREAVLAILDSLSGHARALMVRRHGEKEEWVVYLGGVQARVIWNPAEALIVTVWAG